MMANEPTDRRFLLAALAQFIRHACRVPGVLRIAVIGSLTTEKTTPNDADVLVILNDDADIGRLAALGRKMKGAAQGRNLGADIFLANSDGHYIGRTCSYKQCHLRVACRGRHCHTGGQICDDFQVLRLSDQLVAEPPLEIWPRVVVRGALPADLREILLDQGHAASDSA